MSVRRDTKKRERIMDNVGGLKHDLGSRSVTPDGQAYEGRQQFRERHGVIDRWLPRKQAGWLLGKAHITLKGVSRDTDSGQVKTEEYTDKGVISSRPVMVPLKQVAEERAERLGQEYYENTKFVNGWLTDRQITQRRGHKADRLEKLTDAAKVAVLLVLAGGAYMGRGLLPESGSDTSSAVPASTTLRTGTTGESAGVTTTTVASANTVRVGGGYMCSEAAHVVLVGDATTVSGAAMADNPTFSELVPSKHPEAAEFWTGNESVLKIYNAGAEITVQDGRFNMPDACDGPGVLPV
jgi:hypothetical protein